MLRVSDVETTILRSANGDPWYGPSTFALIGTLSAADAAARRGASDHSVWEIVRHMIAWMREVEHRLPRGIARNPVDGDWPAVQAVDERAWETDRQEFVRACESLATTIGALDTAGMAARCGEERVPELGTGVTYGEMVVGIVQHNAYHTGQIALLVKALRPNADRPV